MGEGAGIFLCLTETKNAPIFFLQRYLTVKCVYLRLAVVEGVSLNSVHDRGTYYQESSFLLMNENYTVSSLIHNAVL